ncbi:DUF481 domain-containing protein [Paracoccus subflavus]|uniref:DUF481 domain-containing protein n=1 Tax=Paracoccus subflavus TaxID=2528244 RepID=A0A4Q9GAJ9_9RHOB|nr:DUF481 domain-containing protein [Paracoccus subflavus]TBN43825.1 DUF481 domain-containing protein [Paracoccus subflavus]
MKKVTLLTGTAALLTALSAPAFAQTEIAPGADATGVSAIDDRITDIEDDVTDDFDRSADSDRFGPADRRQGLFGSMSLQYSGSTGNSDAQDLAIAGRVAYNQAPFAQSVGLAIEFGENENGDKDQEEVSAIYDAQYYFNDQFYAFALGRFEIDSLVDGEADYAGDDVSEELTDLRRDGFLGFGPGYRVINSDTTTWRVQAGVGVRYTQTGQQYIDDESDTETGYIVSSRLYHRFNDMVFITNDTDYLTSDANDVATNEFGVNFRMSEQLATRVSYLTEYQSDREIRTDNTLGVAIVYGF